ncbi:replication protein [uncultured marine virus]|nr:replication protein [uncultured marine virus]
MPGGKHWVFTVNNYDEQTLLHVQLLSESDAVTYCVIGREIAPTTGTPHLQGYLSLSTRKSFAAVRDMLPACHIEGARGTPSQCRTYCIKDGDYDEYGTLPDVQQGKRTDFERFRDWCSDRSCVPSNRTLMLEWPSLYGRYRSAMRAMADELSPALELRTGELRPWQTSLFTRLNEAADDRTVEFYVDANGGSGKSWFCGYMVSKPGVQLLGPGKRDDLAYMIDATKHIFLLNVPRQQMEYVNYGLLESIKDRMVLSTKYESRMKILAQNTHVIVFSNEQPNYEKMTTDRYKVTELN